MSTAAIKYTSPLLLILLYSLKYNPQTYGSLLQLSKIGLYAKANISCNLIIFIVC